MVDSPHGKGVTFTIRSAPVGYAAEYLVLASLRLRMCISPLMSNCILYHIFHRECCTTLHLFPFSHPRTPDVRQTPRSLHCSKSIDSHSRKSCFSVQFVDTYSIHSFPPPSRRTQQIQGFQRCDAGVCRH